jgi:hypothetical protein
MVSHGLRAVRPERRTLTKPSGQFAARTLGQTFLRIAKDDLGQLSAKLLSEASRAVAPGSSALLEAMEVFTW